MKTKKQFNRSGLPVRGYFSNYEYPTVKDSGLTDDQYIAKYGVMAWTAYGNSEQSNSTQSQNQGKNQNSGFQSWLNVLMGKSSSETKKTEETETKDMKTNYIYYILLGIVVVVFVVFLVKFTKK